MGIPIFINLRDRVDPLKQLLAFLPLEDVTLVDNASTYGPLLEFLEAPPCKVVRLTENIGKNAPWIAGVIPSGTPYVVTDPDVIPQAGCPEDFMQFLLEILSRFPDLLKVGLGIDITDIPDHYRFKSYVLGWERQFWPNAFEHHRGVPLYRVALDTTFAIYRANSSPDIVPSMRTGHPYVIKHLPWYINSDAPTEDEIYYKEHADTAVATWVSDRMSPLIKGIVDTQ